MKNIVYINGEFVERNKAKVSIFDKGFLYGDGIFEGIRIYKDNIFKCKEHIDRLYDSASAIGLNIGLTKEKLVSDLVQTVIENKISNGYIRLIVTRGQGDLGINPWNVEGQTTIVIIVQDITLFPKAMYEQGIRIVTSPIKRNIPDSFDPRIKTLNYLGNILAKMYAKDTNYDEAVMLNNQGYVTEGTTNNIFIVKSDKITTPPTYIGALDGVTRKTIISLAKNKGYIVTEEPFTTYDLHTADEIFLTGTAVEILPVREVDGRIINQGWPGKVYKGLSKEFEEITEIDGVKVNK